MNSVNGAIGGLLAAQQASLDSVVSVKLAVKAQEAHQQQGDAILQLLDEAVQFNRDHAKGNSVDSRA